ncbi:FAD dependent oxidoreductase [Xylariomycetidae sp. FL0641]|nr:FAD dependent oxidoreductase [Xylariomycetidae sp. FL0641]
MTQPQVRPGQSGLPVDNPTNSYWHKEPSEKLLGHRTTEELPETADVVIVGSGITGTFAAEFLREKRPDFNIVMLEAREACWGATGRNGGHCQPATYAAAPHIASFELRNFHYLRGLVEEFSIACDWRSTSGVHAFYSPALFATVEGMVRRLEATYPDLAANVALVRPGGERGAPPWLLAQERRELTLAGLRVPDAAGAVVQWTAASLWPYKLVAFVLERLLAANGDGDGGGGFNLQTRTPVTSLSQSTATVGSWTAHTPRGAVTAPRVLLATNGYTSHLLPALADLLVPVRGQVSALLPPPPSPSSSSSSSSNPPLDTAQQQPQQTQTPPLDIGHTFYIEGEADDAFGRDDYLVQRPPAIPPPTDDHDHARAGSELVYGGGRQHARARGLGVSDDAGLDEPVSWYLRGELAGVVDLTAHPTDPSHPSSSSSAEPSSSSSSKKKKKQDLTPTHEWTGIMGYTRDGHPLVGAVPPSLLPPGSDRPGHPAAGGGLFLCAGYTGHGMPNAALCARAAVDILLADTTTTDGGGGDGDGDGDGDDNHEVDLPPEYELTEARVRRARLREPLAAADARGSLWTEFGRRAL